ncbi:MAG: response regulator [Holophaga sp.]|jgi:CheY-like chemotaxis protein
MGQLLIVDDDELVRESIQGMLASLGYKIIQAKDGLEAVSLYKAMRGQISLIVMDIKMPRMDGITATNLIKEFDSKAKIVLISGYAEKIPSGVKPSAFLAKPFNRSTLCEIVQLVLKSPS